MAKFYRYRLATMPHAQCHISIDWNEYNEIEKINLISYSTLVISIYRDKALDKYKMKCTGIYSSTTARHINRFTTEFLGKNQYYLCKSIINSEDYTLSTFEELHVNDTCYKYYYNGKKYFGRY